MKIHVHLERGNRSASRLVIDGHDVTKYALAAGFSVNADPDEPSVSVTFRPDVLEVDGDLVIVIQRANVESEEAIRQSLPLHRTAANVGVACSTCDGGGCLDCTDPA